MVSVSKIDKKGSGGGGGGMCSNCCRLIFLVAAVLVGVLVLDAYEYISVKVAKDTRTTLYAKMKELDPAVIEQQIGMKILAMEDYNKIINEAALTKEQHMKLTSEAAQQKADLDSARQIVVEKETQVTTLVTERDAAQGQVTTTTAERDALAQQVTNLNAEKDALSTQVATLTTEVAALTTERDALKAAPQAAPGQRKLRGR